MSKVDVRVRELDELMEEQAQDMRRGRFQPPEFIGPTSTLSLNGFTQYGTMVDYIKPFNHRKKNGCTLHGYTAYVQYGDRWVCKTCAADRSREYQRRRRRALRKEVSR